MVSSPHPGWEDITTGRHGMEEESWLITFYPHRGSREDKRVNGGVGKGEHKLNRNRSDIL